MPTNYSDEQLTSMSHADLLKAREGVTDQAEQNRLAGFEHRAFARERTEENPANAVGLAAAIPTYAAAKTVGVMKGRSETSVSQMAQGYKGIGEGLANKAESFFGQDFSSGVKQASAAIAETASTAFKFFGVDFGTGEANKPPVAPPRPLPEPSNGMLTVDDVFPKLLQAESGGIHMDAKGKLTLSKAGAEGISQLMPRTAKNPGFGIAPVKDKSEAEYTRVGKEYLSKLYQKFGDWEQALAAYNWGIGNMQKAIGKTERFGGDWKDHLPKETKDYLGRILGRKDAKEG